MKKTKKKRLCTIIIFVIVVGLIIVGKVSGDAFSCMLCLGQASALLGAYLMMLGTSTGFPLFVFGETCFASSLLHKYFLVDMQEFFTEHGIVYCCVVMAMAGIYHIVAKFVKEAMKEKRCSTIIDATCLNSHPVHKKRKTVYVAEYEYAYNDNTYLYSMESKENPLPLKEKIQLHVNPRNCKELYFLQENLRTNVLAGLIWAVAWVVVCIYLTC